MIKLKKDSLVGKVYVNNANQKYKVVQVFREMNSYKYRIRFLKTGYGRVVEKVEMKRGKIKDKFEKSVFGVGYMGNVKMTDHKKEYSVWSGMLERCYHPRGSGYERYGAKGVTVERRWHCFENFLEDLPLIKGYDEILFSQGKIHLDKDKIQINVPINKRKYSLGTCCFLTKKENNNYRDLENIKKEIFALSPEGVLIEAKGIREFARDHGLIKQGIMRCLSGRAKTHKGWKFKYKREAI